MADSSSKSASPQRAWIAALVFVGLCGLLAALLAPAFGRARESGRRASCLSNIHEIGCALNQYSVDNAGRFPTVTNDVASYFVTLTNGNYLGPGRLYVCPSESPPRTGVPLASNNISYGVTVFTDASTNAPGLSGNMPLVFERGVVGAGPSQPVWTLLGRGWGPGSPHGTDGGCVFYVGGQAAFKKTALFDLGLTNNPAITNTIALFPK